MAVADPPAVACLVMIALLVIGVVRWIIIGRDQAATAVTFTTALRRNPADPVALPPRATTRDH